MPASFSQVEDNCFHCPLSCFVPVAMISLTLEAWNWQRSAFAVSGYSATRRLAALTGSLVSCWCLVDCFLDCASVSPLLFFWSLRFFTCRFLTCLFWHIARHSLSVLALLYLFIHSFFPVLLKQPVSVILWFWDALLTTWHPSLLEVGFLSGLLQDTLLFFNRK